MFMWVRALVWVRVFDPDRPSKARLPLAMSPTPSWETVPF